MAATQTFRFRVDSLDDLTHHIRRVRLRPERTGALTFRADQYVSVTFAGPAVLIEAALPALQAHGMLAEHIHADAFYDDHVMKQRHGDTVSPDSKTGTAPMEG